MSKNDLILSIDSGTQSCRAFVWDERGTMISQGKADHIIEHPRLGWFEQDANEWWPAACRAIRQALEKTEVSRIQFLCMSHQRETFVPIGKDGMPLRRAIPHMDMRCEKQVSDVIDKLGCEKVHGITGKYPSYVYSLYEILWIMENEPNIAKKVYKYLDVQGFLLKHLIGEYVTSYVSADPMSLIDIKKKTWSTELMDALGLKREQFLDLCEPGIVVGRITEEASRETGLPSGLPVVSGAGDGICSAFGTRTTNVDRIFFYIGTWTVLGGFSMDYVIDKAFRTLLGVIPGSYHLEGNVTGGYIISWFLENYSRDLESRNEDYWEKAASAIPPGSEGLMTVPYWFGCLAPYWDNGSRGITMGWSGIHTCGHIYRSILEGVSFEQRLIFRRMAEELNTRYSEITFVGGGAKSPLWGQITSDVFGLPINITDTVECSALGAAAIGAAAMGMYPSIQEASEKMTRLELRYRPNKENTPKYDLLFEVYKDIFPALQDKIHELNEVLRRISPGNPSENME